MKIGAAILIGVMLYVGRPFRVGDDGAQAKPAMPATISGVVVTTDSQPQPISRAVVTLSSSALPTSISTITDEAGRFAFVDLPAGRYTAVVWKPAYLTMQYGATRPERPGTPLAIAAGQAADIRVALPRGGVITGTVRDQFGQPASGAQVLLSRTVPMTTVGGLRTRTNFITTSVTDDRGIYRLYGLMPDDYIVSASLPRTGGGEIISQTRADVDARLRALEMRGAAQAPPPASLPGAPTPASVTPADPAPASLTLATASPVGFAPIYYPGTAVATDATPIRVAAGEERSGIDIAIMPVRTARVSVLIRGETPSRIVRPSLSALGPPGSILISPNLSGPDADGVFTFVNVTPGRYRLLARTGPGAVILSSDGRSASIDNSGAPPLFAMTDLVVDGVDITGLVLTLRPAPTISGRVVFDGVTLKPPVNLGSVRVSLSDAAPGLSGMFAPNPSATVRDDSTFVLTGIAPGAYTLQALLPESTGWWLRSIMVNGRDVLDEALEIDDGAQEITGAVITYAEKRSGLDGLLTTSSGQPASEFAVIVYPADRALWKPGSRRIRSARPGTDGSFSVNDLPAGDYLVAAVTDADPDEWRQSSFLEQLVAASVKVTVVQGQRARQDLRIAR